MIIGLIGVIGSGKTYRRDQYVKDGFTPIDFKDSLIEMAEDLIGFKITDYDLFKENVVGLTGPTGNPSKIAPRRMTDDILFHFPHAMTGRALLQRLGTNVMRKRNPNYWVEAWVGKARHVLMRKGSVVCADCRFPNELKIIKQLATDHKHEYKFIFCDYRSERYDASGRHESEKLAQEMLKRGFKDGQEIQNEVMK